MKEAAKRRKFIKQSVGAAIGVTAGFACSPKAEEKSVNINFNETYRWKMTTTWPPNFPVLGEGCKLMAEWVREMSGGRMDITVFGGGELIPALEGFDAVSNGAVEMNHGAAYYWAGKIPASPFFCAVPFGMNSQQMNAWITSGGGSQLWEELYAPFNILPMISGNTAAQMGGWFNKAIETPDDLQGLKMRIPGLGGKVIAKMGGSPVTVSGGEIYTNLERGVIDATEWIGPYHDYKMGFHQVAKYYYYPGWQEPGPVLEMSVNKDKFLSLPKDLQEIIRTACHRLNTWMMVEFEAKNGTYLQKIIDEGKTELKRFPKEVIAGLKAATQETLEELTASDASSKKIYEHYLGFRKKIIPWADISEKIFYDDIS
ncbi:TRAP transporter substrate-binding protein [Marinoscillum sp. MHG1-6]|uniref:TRAP transporter substrate-binding protein n=1 Tax=Marinoscillum sp. MHG1-6 TaxID=2959627 RepID=UPI0021580DAE|nr:TRAP transporter substrate-binding protein DctP [Marinoscillum sp. MHG1-6]